LSSTGTNFSASSSSSTQQEKDKAGMSTYNVNNFYGPVGHSNVQQGTTESVQVVNNTEPDLEKASEFLEKLKELRGKLCLEKEKEAELEADI
jgi:hypothetical protein